MYLPLLNSSVYFQSLGGAGTLIVKENTKGSLSPLSENETHYNFTLAFLHNSSYTHIMVGIRGDGEVNLYFMRPIYIPWLCVQLYFTTLLFLSVKTSEEKAMKYTKKQYLSSPPLTPQDAGDEVTVGLYSPEASPLPLSLLVIWVLAMFSVSVGAFWSGKVRHKLWVHLCMLLCEGVRFGVQADGERW